MKDVNTISTVGGHTVAAARNIKKCVLDGRAVNVFNASQGHEDNLRTVLQALGVNPNHHLITWVQQRANK